MRRDTMKPAITRRRALAAAAVAAVAPALLGRAALAAERCVVGTWGGDYARLLRENIDGPLLKPKGMEIVQAVGDEAPRLAQLVAQKQLPRGALDIACLGAPNGFVAGQKDLIETLDAAKVPNLKNVVPLLHSGSFMPNQFVPHIYSAQGFAYNPNTVKDPPKTWADLLDPRWKGKIGGLAAAGMWVMMGAALAEGGNPNALDKAKEYLLKLNANGLRLYPQTDDMAPGFKSGEIEVGIIWLARTVMWQNADFPVAGRMPEEGAIVYVSGMVMPKNAPDKEGAYAYMNALLEPPAQRGFAAHMGYLPTVTNAELTGKVADQLKLPADAKLVQPDYEQAAKVQPEMNDWWLKNIMRK
ncbi:MAG TPA: extracellular solute-binding protein [Stellaceae bacterium]|jgi:putative spermidine/putrescine transport system substrate-binding protein|nr:extracellular solute-binding protein [Stellaceae bacterium]